LILKEAFFEGCGILCSAKLSILQETQKSLILKEALLVFARILCSAKKKYEHTSLKSSILTHKNL